jgi:hypothetical protein
LTAVRVISIDGNEIGNWQNVLVDSGFEGLAAFGAASIALEEIRLNASSADA